MGITCYLLVSSTGSGSRRLLPGAALAFLPEVPEAAGAAAGTAAGTAAGDAVTTGCYAPRGVRTAPKLRAGVVTGAAASATSAAGAAGAVAKTAAEAAAYRV